MSELTQGVGTLNQAGSLKDPQTQEANEIQNNLDLFAEPFEDHQLRGSRLMHFMPKSLSGDAGPFIFDITAGAANQYLSMHDARLLCTYSVETDDVIPEPIMKPHVDVPPTEAGKEKSQATKDAEATNKSIDEENATAIKNTKLKREMKVGQVNLFPYSLFKSADVEVNNIPITGLNTGNYSWKMYLEHGLTYNSIMANTAGSNYFRGLSLGDVRVDHVDQLEFRKDVRKTIPALDNNKRCNFSVPLIHDFFKTRKLMVPGVNLRLTLGRNNDYLSLMYDKHETKNYRIKIHMIKVQFRVVEVDDSIAKAQTAALQSLTRPAVYPYTRTELKTFPIAQKETNVNLQNCNQGFLPNRSIVCFIKTSTFNGQRTTDPFNFQPFNIRYYNWMRNGTCVSGTPYSFTKEDLDNVQVSRIWRDLLDNAGIKNDNNGLTFNHHDWVKNCCFFVHDFSPGCDGGDTPRPIYWGEDTLQIQFAEGNPGITIMIYNSYADQYYVGRDGAVALTRNQIP